jgi:YVTN family beta-propeller protein
MVRMHHSMSAGFAAACLLAAAALAQSGPFVNWESPQAHPIELTPNGQVLVAVNTADARLEVFDLVGGNPVRRGSVPVGLDPVSVRALDSSTVWVVNQISDSISIVDLPTMRVTRTVPVGDEPADVVFAGTPRKAFVSLSVAERVAVLDASAATILTTVPIVGSQPRALAASPDGSAVYLAIFESGNHSTLVPRNAVSAPSGPYGGQNPPPNDGNSFSPPRAPGLPPGPPVPHIVRKNGESRWMDGNGRDWSSSVTWDLHDHDIAVIDAQSLAVTYVSGLMNIVSGIGVSPRGDVVAVGTDSRNDLRFEQNVNGVFVRVVASIMPRGAASGSVIDLNPHLDYSSPTTTVVNRLRSVGDPRGVAIGPDGSIWTAGLGSNSVVSFSAAGERRATVPVGEGPTGVVLSDDGSRAYVLNRFEASVSAISTTSSAEVARVTFHDPTPADVRAGRKFLFDTHLTSGLGQASCASCHVDGRSDRIAWDLGNTQGSILLFDELCQAPAGCINWHPMKGPMTTQTLFGIIGNEPFHWRGEKENLADFNEAYVKLQGRDSEITAAEMESLQRYVASLTFGPNPNRNIDNSLRTSLPITGGVVTGTGGTGNPVNGQNIFNTQRLFGAPPGLRCVDCHSGPAGTNNRVDIPGPIESQNRKNAPLRDTFRKVGANQQSLAANRGFGFDHAGAEATLQDLLNIGFGNPQNPFPPQARRDIEAFCLSFGTDTHAGVGQQVTARNGGGAGDDTARITQLIGIATGQPAQVALIAKGVRNGQPRGWMMQGGTFVSDRAGESISPAALLAGAAVGSEVTYTLVPPSMARRLGIDRDGDNALDGDELAAGTDPADPSSYPGACAADIAPVGALDGTVNGSDLSVLLSSWGTSGLGDLDGNGTVNGLDLSVMLSAWGPCGD